MRTGIRWLLAAATGPTHLRQDLQRKTAPLRSLPPALAKTKALRTAIPDGILGGELLSLLSYRMQAALLSDEDLTLASGTSPVPAVSLPLQQDTPAAARTDSPASATRPVGERSAAGEASARPAERNFRAPVSEPRRAMPGHSHPLASAGLSSGQPLPDAHETPTSPDHRAAPAADANRTRDARRRFPESALARRLRRYWQMSEQEPVPSSLTHAPRAEDLRPTGVSWPPVISNPSATRTWPDLVGRTATRKINQLQHEAYEGVRPSQQTIHAEAPENVEIRNVFNIALPGGSDGRHQTDTQLAETIANILRDQALQHGIDLT